MKLKSGGYYYTSDPDGFWILGKKGRKKVIEHDTGFNCEGILISSHGHFGRHEWTFKDNERSCREATPQEKVWLDECIKAKRYIPKEEFLKLYVDGT